MSGDDNLKSGGVSYRPSSYSLSQRDPNPFNPTTAIEFPVRKKMILVK